MALTPQLELKGSGSRFRTLARPVSVIGLLRVLQERPIKRPGSCRTISVDVPAVAATNRDLECMVQYRQVRADVHYRLEVTQ